MILKFLSWLFAWKKHKTISKTEAKRFSQFLVQAEKLDAKHQMIEIDKIYHNILKSLGYQGTFGEILKQNPKEILNINEVWELHKFRNTLVHELRDVDERYIRKQGKRYLLIVRKFIQKVTK